MKAIIAVVIISIVTAIAVSAQPVNIAAAVQNSAAAASPQTSVSEGPSDIQGSVASKNYLAEREKTQKGAPLSPLNNPAVQPGLKRSEDKEAEPEKHEFIYRVTAPPPMDAKARYDAFLRSKGIDPNTIGAATVVNGRMFVPTIEEQYAARKSSYAALNRTLAGAPNFARRWWAGNGASRIRADVSAPPKNASDWRNTALYTNWGDTN
jgi:hypothetical protein